MHHVQHSHTSHLMLLPRGKADMASQLDRRSTFHENSLAQTSAMALRKLCGNFHHMIFALLGTVRRPYSRVLWLFDYLSSGTSRRYKSIHYVRHTELLVLGDSSDGFTCCL
jgi:hypothetical protein